jgi:hypothetical protein
MQQQLEIKFFYPLTEQVPLELDFTPSEQWVAEFRKKQWNHNTVSYDGTYLIGTGTGTATWSLPSTDTFVVKPNTKNVGKWEITKGMFVYRPTKPNAIIRFMVKYLLGFKWHDEI